MSFREVEPWRVDEDTQANVPVVLNGAQPSVNITIHLSAAYGQLFVAHDDSNGENSSKDAGKFLILLGSQEELNKAVEDVCYAPPENWNSPAQATFDTISVFTIEDDFEDSGAPWTLLVRVIPVNDPPSLHGPSEIIVLESRPTLVQGIEVKDIDVHESRGVLEVKVSVEEEGSLVELGTAIGLYVTESSPEAKTFQGSVSVVNAALKGLTYRGPPQFSGRDELVVTVDDRGNTGEGGRLTASLVVAIIVHSVNDPPRVMRDDGLLLHGVEDESIAMEGIKIEDADAGDASVKLVLEARYGKISLKTDDIQLDFLAGSGLLDARALIIGTLEVWWRRLAVPSFFC